MKFKEPPIHIVELVKPTKCSLLVDIKAAYPIIEALEENEYPPILAICDDDDSIDYAYYQFSSRTLGEEPVYYECIWHGHGYGGSLREMRHTYFKVDDNGYVFYLDIKGTIRALEILKRYFD